MRPMPLLQLNHAYGACMDIRTLRWFQQVADGATVTEVGEMELVSQPAISRALARLDAEVGAPLLRRHGRVLRMTAAGSAFKRHVDEVLHRLDDGIAAVAQTVDPELGTVRLGFQLSLATWLVPDVVRAFRAAHPGVQLALTQVADGDADRRLDDGSVDLLLSAARTRPGLARREHLLAEPLRIALAADHPLARSASLRIEQLRDEDFLVLREPAALRERTVALGEAAGFAPRIGFEGDDVATLAGLVAAGLGVALLPSSVRSDPSAPNSALRLVPLEPAVIRDIAVAWVRDRPLLPAAALLRDELVARGRDGSLERLLADRG